jgi:hypothetical protein
MLHGARLSRGRAARCCRRYLCASEQNADYREIHSLESRRRPPRWTHPRRVRCRSRHCRRSARYPTLAGTVAGTAARSSCQGSPGPAGQDAPNAPKRWPIRSIDIRLGAARRCGRPPVTPRFSNASCRDHRLSGRDWRNRERDQVFSPSVDSGRSPAPGKKRQKAQPAQPPLPGGVRRGRPGEGRGRVKVEVEPAE